MKGTLHATPKEEKEEMDYKAKKGFWPCQSYKCTKSGSNHMNPKYAEKCTRCGAMKPLGAGSDVFNHGMSEKALPAEPVQVQVKRYDSTSLSITTRTRDGVQKNNRTITKPPTE